VTLGTNREADLTETRESFWRRHRWLVWVGGALLAVMAALGVAVALLAHRTEPYLKAQIVEGLQKRFHARVELDSFHISFGNGLKGRWGVWAEGRGLRIWPPVDAEARRDLETTGKPDSEALGGTDAPLIRVEAFRFHAPLRFERGKPLVISVVRMEGLDIDVPPRKHKAQNLGGAGASANRGKTAKPSAGRLNGAQQAAIASSAPGSTQESAASEANEAQQTPASQVHKDAGLLWEVVVDRVECDRAEFVLETDKPGKLPLGFAIAHLTLTNVTADGPFGFVADLTNPKPLGQIHTTGSFGPWQTGDAGASPVSGDYLFQHADLGGFKGIAGILNSTGRYQGTLANIVVDGETDTPDFRLTNAENPMHLHTRFHANVDGTDGDTWLNPVDATLGQSHFTVQGQIVRFQPPDQKSDGETRENRGSSAPTGALLVKGSPFKGGHDIALNVNIDRARIEDFLHLATRGNTPLLTGAVTVKSTTLHIPAGEAPVPERLRLRGKFTLDQVRFSSARIQGGIEQLSLRGQGHPKELKTADASTVRSHMEGDFQMGGGVITLPALIYSVPGANIDLTGTYGVMNGALDFTGDVKMNATISQMVGGWKGLLLKPANRFFKKNGAGTDVPIHIGGTREGPTFGIEFGRMKKKLTQQPEAKQP
jgi:hypothetical protein